MRSREAVYLAWTVAIAAGIGAVGRVEAQTTYYVSPSGSDLNPGTDTHPFRSVQRGVDALAAAGDELVLRAGRYVGAVLVRRKHGTATAPIVIRADNGAAVSIDSYARLTPPQWPPSGTLAAWEPASLHDANAHAEEYVSTGAFREDLVNRGAFLDFRVHTRLITYSRLEDLRAENETFEQIYAPDGRPGPTDVYEKCGCQEQDPTCVTLPDTGVAQSCAPEPNRYKRMGYRYPWVYMGPGLWFDKTTGRVHIRLSHTHNRVHGLADYGGEKDPRRIALAIAPKDAYALRIEYSSHLLLKDLDIRFGGEETVELAGSASVPVASVTFDHVRFWAGTRAVRMGVTADVVFRDCLFDGGLPEWFFRNDLKGEYYFRAAGTKIVALNGRGNTADTLLLGSGQDRRTVVEHSEFVNGHDLYLVGKGFQFHHNWIHNLNDEALVLDGYHLSDAHIHDNLIEQSLSAISMAGTPTDVGGARYIYRNVIDLREPTAGIRPRNANERDVWRYGHLFKSNGVDGPLDLFHNTFIVKNQDEQASYLHLDSRLQVHPRRSLDNIFVAVNGDPLADKAITYLPDPNGPFATDGNDYFRVGYVSRHPYRHLAYDCGRSAPCPAGTFASLGGPALPALRQSAYFQDSRRGGRPGFEASGLEVDPQFESLTPDESPQPTDDFRLSSGSPLRGLAVELPADLAEIDPYHGLPGGTDIGALPHGSDPLRVGIGGRRVVGEP